MPDFVKVLSAIIAGQEVSPDDFSSLTVKERELLSECGRLGCGRGFFRDIRVPANGDVGQREAFNRKVEAVAKTLRDICRLESNSLELNISQINIKSLIMECVEEFHEHARREGIKLLARIDSQPLRVYADRDRVKQIISIYLSNAIKFTSEGGAVEVLAKGLPQEVIITVNDSGVGIDFDSGRRVFQRFSQPTGQPGLLKGSGLQLNLGQLLAKAHRGRVWAEPGQNGGSAFSFCLPREMACNLQKPKKIGSFFS